MSDWWSADPVAGAQNVYGKRISSIESGGNYQAIGPQTKGGRALGKYQVMSFNVGPWTREALGKELTPGQFLASPEAQEAVFNHKFGSYVSKYGPEGAARAWFAGEEGMNNPNARDVRGTSVSDYSRKFMGQGPINASSVNRSNQPQSNWWASDPVASAPEKTAQPQSNWWASDPVASAPEKPAAPEQRQPEGPPPPPVNIAQKAIEPITSYIPTQQQMAQEGLDQMRRGGGQMQTALKGEDAMGYPMPAGEQAWEAAKGVGNLAVGGIGYVASPVNAALRTFAGKPIEENVGIPKEWTETALGFVVPVPGANMASIRSVPQVVNPRTLTAGERVVQAGQNLGRVGSSGPVNIPRAVASDNMATQRTAATVANVPIAGNPLVKAAGNTTEQLATKSQEIAAGYGSASPITAGDAASSAIKNWIIDKSKESVKRAYDRVDNLVDDTIRTPLNETLGVAQSILSRRANANITEKSEAVRRVEEAVTNPGGLNYQGVKDLRTYIGELLEKKILPADIRESELKQIYGSLSKDLRTAVENAGGARALSAFERANKYNALISARRESLAKIVGANGDTPAAQVFDRLIGMAGNTTRADMSKLAEARKAMGADAWNEVASGVISQMGRAQDATGNVIFSPQRFLTAYQTKLSDAGRNMLFRAGGKQNLAPYLDDIATISGRFRELQKFSNPSGTGQTTAGFAGFMGAAIDPVSTIGAGIGMNLVARALASPATLAPMAQWSRKYELVLRAPTPANVAQLTIASRNLANTINSQFGASVQWQDLIKATQGSVKGRAEDEQQKPERVVN